MALTKIDDRGLKTPIDLLDNEKIRLGTGNDLEVYHNGSDSVISNSTGVLKTHSSHFYVRNAAGTETNIECHPNGAVNLFYDNVKTFETTGGGAIIRGTEGGDANLFFYADEGDDNADQWRLQAHSDGSFKLLNYADGANEINIEAHGAGNVELYYDNSKKLETTSDGAKVTGNLTVTTGNSILTNSSQGQLTVKGGATYPGGAIKFAGGQSGATDQGTTIFYAGEATSLEERMRINSVGQVWIGSSAQYGPNAYNLADKGVTITAAGENALKVLDSTAYAADVGGAILLGGNYRSTGDTQPFVELKSFKENGTDTNYAYGFRIGTSANGAVITERLRIHSGGDVEVKTGSLIIGTAGEGIDFSATSGTGSSERLEDYEEGTWTPTVGVGTISKQNCTYTKIGRFVKASGEIWDPSNTTNGGTFQLQNLPFASANSTAAGCSFSKDIDINAPCTYISGNTNISFYGNNTGNAWTYILHSHLSSTSYIYFEVSYQTS